MADISTMTAAWESLAASASVAGCLDERTFRQTSEQLLLQTCGELSSRFPQDNSSDRAFREISRCMTLVRVPYGEGILHRNDQNEDIFIVLAGTVTEFCGKSQSEIDLEQYHTVKCVQARAEIIRLSSSKRQEESYTPVENERMKSLNENIATSTAMLLKLINPSVEALLAIEATHTKKYFKQFSLNKSINNSRSLKENNLICLMKRLCEHNAGQIFGETAIWSSECNHTVVSGAAITGKNRNSSNTTPSAVLLARIKKADFVKIFPNEMKKRDYIRDALSSSFNEDLKSSSQIVMLFKEMRFEKHQTIYTYDKSKKNDFLMIISSGTIEARHKHNQEMQKVHEKNNFKGLGGLLAQMKVQLQGKRVQRKEKNKRIALLGAGSFLGYEGWNEKFADEEEGKSEARGNNHHHHQKEEEVSQAIEFVALEHDTVLFSIQRKAFKDHSSKEMWNLLLKNASQRLAQYIQIQNELSATIADDGDCKGSDDFMKQGGLLSKEGGGKARERAEEVGALCVDERERERIAAAKAKQQQLVLRAEFDSFKKRFDEQFSFSSKLKSPSAFSGQASLIPLPQPRAARRESSEDLTKKILRVKAKNASQHQLTQPLEKQQQSTILSSPVIYHIEEEQPQQLVASPSQDLHLTQPTIQGNSFATISIIEDEKTLPPPLPRDETPQMSSSVYTGLTFSRSTGFQRVSKNQKTQQTFKSISQSPEAKQRVSSIIFSTEGSSYSNSYFGVKTSLSLARTTQMLLPAEAPPHSQNNLEQKEGLGTPIRASPLSSRRKLFISECSPSKLTKDISCRKISDASSSIQELSQLPRHIKQLTRVASQEISRRTIQQKTFYEQQQQQQQHPFNGGFAPMDTPPVAPVREYLQVGAAVKARMSKQFGFNELPMTARIPLITRKGSLPVKNEMSSSQSQIKMGLQLSARVSQQTSPVKRGLTFVQSETKRNNSREHSSEDLKSTIQLLFRGKNELQITSSSSSKPLMKTTPTSPVSHKNIRISMTRGSQEEGENISPRKSNSSSRVWFKINEPAKREGGEEEESSSRITEIIEKKMFRKKIQGFRMLNELEGDLINSTPNLLLVHNTNPVYQL